jgi:hypothetical protein
MAAPLECQIQPEAQLDLVSHVSFAEIENLLAQQFPYYQNFACFLEADPEKVGQWYTQCMHAQTLKTELKAAIKDRCKFIVS